MGPGVMGEGADLKLLGAWEEPGADLAGSWFA